MKFTELDLPGVYLIEPEKKWDERGYFARLYDDQEFQSRQLHTNWAQVSVAYNRSAGTLRGLHYQAAPHEEIKLIQCLRGQVYDVLLDLRREHQTYAKWIALNLDGETRQTVYVPQGIAHGYQTLTDDTELLYHISCPYAPASALGVRWNDPKLNITWPKAISAISPRDASFNDIDT